MDDKALVPFDDDNVVVQDAKNYLVPDGYQDLESYITDKFSVQLNRFKDTLPFANKSQLSTPLANVVSKLRNGEPLRDVYVELNLVLQRLSAFAQAEASRDTAEDPTTSVLALLAILDDSENKPERYTSDRRLRTIPRASSSSSAA